MVKADNKKKYNKFDSDAVFWNKTIFWVPALIILALILSYFRLVHFTEFGDITLFSMFAIYLLGYFYGGLKGMGFALIFSLCKFGLDIVLTEYVFAVPFIDVENLGAEFADYITGYTLMAAGGFFAHPWKKKQRVDYHNTYYVRKKRELLYLCGGFLMGVLFRYISSMVNFLMFYREGKTFSQTLSEAFMYCFGYIDIEALLTVIMLMIPVVRKSVEYCQYVATHEYKLDIDNI